MKHPFAASLLAFSLVVGPTAALAASAPVSSDTRYFVQTTKAFWRTTFSARNVFESGFTADLSGFQLKVAHWAGLKLVPVKKYNVLVAATASPSPTASVSPVPTPSEAFGWGVRAILDGKAATGTGGKGITVAVLDTGIDREHPDLTRRVAACVDYASPGKAGTDDSCADENGHGTHVAGIIAADGGPDGLGISGVAPQADLAIYRACDRSGLCYSDDIAAALTAAVDAGAKIAVLGFGGEQPSSLIDKALTYAASHDVLVVAAAGNDGPYEDSMDWPARDTRVVSVGAIARDGSVADFSSRGINATTKPYHIDEGDLEMVAPGVNIESTFPDGSYAILSGTSMAAPHIAGLAARLWQDKAEHPAEATRALLHKLAGDVAPDGDDSGSGWGFPILK